MDKRRINMLKAAIPYATAGYRKPLQILLQTEELRAFIVGEEDDDLSACDTDKDGDIFGLMESIRPFCNPYERDMVDTVLNVMKTREMVNIYRAFASEAFDEDNNDNEENS